MDECLEKQERSNVISLSIREAVLRDSPTNLALQRLQSRILKNSAASEVISSYDRMHHRHNRS